MGSNRCGASMPEPITVRIVRYILIVLACLCAPFYGLWLASGMIADRIEKRKYQSPVRSSRRCSKLWNAS
jgi:hypothetical protein